MKSDEFKSKGRIKSQRNKSKVHLRRASPRDNASSRNRKGNHRDSCRSSMASSSASDDDIDIDIPMDDYADKMEGFALWANDRRQDATSPCGVKDDYALMNKVEEMVQDAVSTGHPQPWVVAQDYLDGLGYWPAYWRSTTLTLFLSH